MGYSDWKSSGGHIVCHKPNRYSVIIILAIIKLGPQSDAKGLIYIYIYIYICETLDVS